MSSEAGLPKKPSQNLRANSPPKLFTTAEGNDRTQKIIKRRKEKDEALRLGASSYVVAKGTENEKLDVGSSKLDALIVTSSVELKWDSYLPLLKPRAMIIPLTVHFGNFSISQYPLMGNGLRIQGTVIASRFELGQMLEFAARTGVRPVMMTFPLTKDGIEESMNALSEGKMRYRGVLIPE